MRFFLIALALAALAGCGVPHIYSEPQQSYLDSALTPRNQWTASGTVSNPALAIDNRLDTAATAPRDFANHYITLDLAKSCVFNMIVIDHGLEHDGFARTLEISVSQDNSDFRLAYTGFGARRSTIILLPKPTIARYIRIRSLSQSDLPWSIAEIYIQ